MKTARRCFATVLPVLLTFSIFQYFNISFKSLTGVVELGEAKETDFIRIDGLLPGMDSNFQQQSELKRAQLQQAIQLLLDNEEKLKEIDEEYDRKYQTSGAANNACALFHMEAAHKRFYVTSIWNTSRSYDADDVTLVTQMSTSRLEIFSYLVKHWTGPIAVSVYGSLLEIRNFSSNLQLFPEMFNRTNINMNFVVKSGSLYPVNHLRNLAWNLVKTKYVFLNDLDFIPQRNLHQTLLGYFKQGYPLSETQLLVIPVFEFLQHPGSFYPENKTVLTKLYKQKAIQIFHGGLDHGPTRYVKWFGSKAPYKIEWGTYYEPYIVGRADLMPRYNERFVGRQFNKIHQIHEMHLMGFDFLVLHDVYLVHYPHKKSPQVSREYQRCVFAMFSQLIREKKQKLNT